MWRKQMPFLGKLALSIALLLIAAVGWFYMRQFGEPGPQRALAFLGPFMAFSLWIFPEVMRRPSDGKLSRR
jgi:hypothetical protein